MTSEKKESIETHINRYELLSQFHPCLKIHDSPVIDLTTDTEATLALRYYWKLGCFLTKDILLKKASDNFKLAISTKDTEYLGFLETYLKKEGYEIDLKKDVALQDLESCINQKPKIKLQISMKTPSPITKIEEPKTHSKIKTKQHEQALVIQKLQESKQEKRLNIKDSTFLNAIRQIGYLIPSDGSIGLEKLKRVIIIYISQKDLQVGSCFRLDERLKYILYGLPKISADSPNSIPKKALTCSYFELKAVLSQRLSQIENEPATDNLFATQEAEENPDIKPINRIPVKKVKNIIV